MSKVFVVVLNWNGKKDTLQCLQSLEKAKKDNFSLDVVIVDNASTDDSVAAIKLYKPKNFKKHIMESPDNAGFAGGNNLGIHYSLALDADYILILNNDTILDKNTIAEFLNAAKKYPKAGIFSPKIYFARGFEYHKKYKQNELGKVIWYAGGEIDWNNVYASNYGVDQVDNGQFDQEREIDFATGACMFIRASTLKRVGLFDERYYLYMEDVDLSMRMKKYQYTIYYIPSAYLWHKVSQSSGIGSDLNDYYTTRNRLLFGITYAPLRAKFALLRESFWLAQNGREWQKVGARDFYLRNFGRGSWR
jgi:GT2 family glycosyltransferase